MSLFKRKKKTLNFNKKHLPTARDCHACIHIFIAAKSLCMSLILILAKLFPLSIIGNDASDWKAAGDCGWELML